MPTSLTTLLNGVRGHFQMESGYHSELWFNLDKLLAQRKRLQPFVTELARKISLHPIDAVCGPMTGGAELAQRIAEILKIDYFHTERIESPDSTVLFPVKYIVPATQRSQLAGRNIAIVDDAISAGSAIKGTYADLLACGAKPTVASALIIFGNAADSFAAEKNLKLECVERIPFDFWKPDACPLCRSGVPFEKVSDANPPADRGA